MPNSGITSAVNARLTDEYLTLCGVSEVNRENVRLFIRSWVALLSDSPLNRGVSKKPLRLYYGLLRDIKAMGFKNTVLHFSALSHELVSRQRLYGQSSLHGDWIHDFTNTPVFVEYNHWFNCGDIESLEFLYTWLNFGKKLFYVDETFHEAAFRGWLDIENKLTLLSFDSDHVTEELHVLAEQLLPRFEITNFFPKFGPKNVAEGFIRHRGGKLQNFHYDRLIDRFLLHGHVGRYGLGEDFGLTSDKAVPFAKPWRSVRRSSSRISVLRFVPKDLKVSRSICMEPNVLMYFQQAILSVMLSLLDRSPLNRFIDLRDQSRNRQLAEIGSYTSFIDTIDLSSASDTLSLALVKAVFPKSWLIPMLVTRSHLCRLPSGDSIPLKKFAPMGSALCFPTQCILFTLVLVRSACLIAYNATPYTSTFADFCGSFAKKVVSSFESDVDYRRSPWIFNESRVYGDDICLDSRLTDEVMATLGHLGFKVNTQKSFIGSQAFRESCGGFYLDGADVTPLYYRVRTDEVASFITSAVALANHSFTRGYRHLYRLLVSELDKQPLKVAYINPDAPYFGVFSTHPNNDHLDRRYHVDYQSHEVRCVGPVAAQVGRKIKTDLVDPYEYLRFQADHNSALLGRPKERHTRYDTGGAGVDWVWMPADRITRGGSIIDQDPFKTGSVSVSLLGRARKSTLYEAMPGRFGDNSHTVG